MGVFQLADRPDVTADQLTQAAAAAYNKGPYRITCDPITITRGTAL